MINPAIILNDPLDFSVLDDPALCPRTMLAVLDISDGDAGKSVSADQVLDYFEATRIHEVGNAEFEVHKARVLDRLSLKKRELLS